MIELFRILSAKLSRFQGRFAMNARALVQQGAGGIGLGAVTGDDLALLRCGPSDLAACETVAERFAAYATGDGPEDFPSRVSAEPGLLGHWLEPWTAVSPSASPPREVPPGVASARESLLGLLEARLRVSDRLRALQAFSWRVEPDRRARLDQDNDVAWRDVDILRSALDRCYWFFGLEDAAGIAACEAGARLESLVARGYDGTLDLATLDAAVR